MRRWPLFIVPLLILATAFGYLIARFHDKDSVAAPAAAPALNGQAKAEVEGRAARESKLKAARKSLSTLSADTQPLKDVFTDLSVQAKAGNVDAATRLYRDLSRCRSLPSTESAISSLSDDILKRVVDEMDASQLESYQSELESVEINKSSLQSLRHLCDGVTDSMYGSRFWALQRAAELGDPYARACALQQGPGFDMHGLASQPQLIEQYRISAPSLIQSGLAAGDWRVVEILNDAYGPDSNSLLSGVLDGDPVQRYRYLKLYRLGYHLENGLYSSAQLDRRLAEAASSLTAAQLADADSWAQDTFQGQFRGNDVSESTMTWGNACAF